FLAIATLPVNTGQASPLTLSGRRNPITYSGLKHRFDSNPVFQCWIFLKLGLNVGFLIEKST
ncbi:hypothetical protein, partial [Cyclobacterium amurskyense]|uniref:hypothetical protein n=1 Tax=Cyclobacterium amurskyense TaxID=320787 RepID=UPI0030DC5540